MSATENRTPVDLRAMRTDSLEQITGVTMLLARHASEFIVNRQQFDCIGDLFRKSRDPFASLRVQEWCDDPMLLGVPVRVEGFASPTAYFRSGDVLEHVEDIKAERDRYQRALALIEKGEPLMRYAWCRAVAREALC